MNEATNIENIACEDLRCPITLDLFRDPVLAGDGHVYEREAITRWISEFGTSPFTRESLQIDDLQPDGHLRQLADQRRNSTVSSSVPHLIPMKLSITKLKVLKICLSILFIAAIPVGIVLAIRFGFKTSPYNSSLSTADYSRYQVLSNYSNSLINNNNSVFTPPDSLNQTAYYELVQLTILTNGSYTFLSISSINTNDYLYDEYFNASNPTANVKGHFSNQSPLSVVLIHGNYSLVVSSYETNTTGNFTISISGPTTVILH